MLEYMDRGYVVTYGQRLGGHVSLISHPYGDSSAAYLGTTILTILLFTTTINQYTTTFSQHLGVHPCDTNTDQWLTSQPQNSKVSLEEIKMQS